jgi:hypothetical protein
MGKTIFICVNWVYKYTCRTNFLNFSSQETLSLKSSNLHRSTVTYMYMYAESSLLKS